MHNHVHASMQRFVLGDNSIPRYVSAKDRRVGSRICTAPHLIHRLGQGCPDQHLDNLHCDAILGQDFLTKYFMILCMFALSLAQSHFAHRLLSAHGAAPSLARAVAASR